MGSFRGTHELPESRAEKEWARSALRSFYPAHPASTSKAHCSTDQIPSSVRLPGLIYQGNHKCAMVKDFHEEQEVCFYMFQALIYNSRTFFPFILSLIHYHVLQLHLSFLSVYLCTHHAVALLTCMSRDWSLPQEHASITSIEYFQSASGHQCSLSWLCALRLSRVRMEGLWPRLWHPFQLCGVPGWLTLSAVLSVSPNRVPRA